MADRQDNIFLNYIARLRGEGIAKIGKQTRDLNRETKDANRSVRDLLGDMQKAASQRKVELLDESSFDNLRAARAELERVQAELEAIAGPFRRAFTLDPKVRRITRDQISNLQNYHSELEGAIDVLQRQRQAVLALRDAEKQHQAAIDAKTFASGQEAAVLRTLVNQRRANLEAIEREGPGIERTVRDLRTFSSDADRTGRQLESAGRQAASFGGRLEQLTARLRQVFPILRGLAVILVTALVPGIIALAGALAGAAVAAVGMGSAIATSLVPGIAVLLGFFSRLKAVMQAVQTRQQALQAQQRASQQTASQLAQAEESRRSALQRIADASKAVEEAEVERLRAIRDAAEQASDALRDLEHAKLGVQEAKLETRQAVLDLKELRDEVGATGAGFDDLFKRFTDADVQFDKKAFSKALAAAGVTEGTQEAIDMERAVLRVREARLGEKDAIDQVGDAQQRLADSSQGVIAAEERLAAAHREAADAARAARLQQLQAADAAGASNTQLEHAKQLMDDLSGAERGLARRLLHLRETFLTFIRTGTDPIFRAISGVIDKLRELRKTTEGKFLFGVIAESLKAVGDAFGRVITNFADFATSRTGVTIFALGAQLLKQFLDLLGGPIMRNALTLIGNLAAAFGTGTVDVLKLLNRGLKHLADATSGLDDQDQPVLDAVFAFKELLRLIGAVGDAIVAFAGAAARPGGELVKWIREGVEAFTDWLRSAEGKKSVKQFFKEAIPFIKTMVKFVLKLGLVFLNLFEFFAPALTRIFDGLNTVLDIINAVLGLLNKLPGPIKTVLGLFVLGGLLQRVSGPIALITLALGALGDKADDVWQAIKGGILGFPREIKRMAEKVGAAFEFLINLVKKILGIDSPSKVFMQIGVDIVLGLIEGIQGAIGLIVNGARWLVNHFIEGVKRIAEKWAELARWIIGKIGDGLRAAKDFVLTQGERIVGWLISGIKGIATDLFDVGKSIIEGVIKGVASMKDEFRDALKDVFGFTFKIAKNFLGARSPSKLYQGLGESMMQGLALGVRTAAPAAERAIKGALGSIASDPLGVSVSGSIARDRRLHDVDLRNLERSALRATAAGINIEQQTVQLPAPPSGGIYDPRYAAVQFAREVARRGG